MVLMVQLGQQELTEPMVNKGLREIQVTPGHKDRKEIKGIQVR